MFANIEVIRYYNSEFLEILEATIGKQGAYNSKLGNIVLFSVENFRA